MPIKVPSTLTCTVIALSLMLGGCANRGNAVIAASGTTIGVGISEHPADGSAQATLGYKRTELAYVPTNRDGGDKAGKSGAGARDSANVIMELRYAGIFSMGENSGIYQRLAVGDIAVQQPGSTALFLKSPTGSIDPEAAKALANVRRIPAISPNDASLVSQLSTKFTHAGANAEKFNKAARDNGYTSSTPFAEFLADGKVTTEKVQAIKKSLESNGIIF